MKTRMLTGRALDYAVALAEGHAPIRKEASEHVWFLFLIDGYTRTSALYVDGPAGDLIIDRELIETSPYEYADRVVWWAYLKDCNCGHEGATRREAAMRTYVASKLGDEVDIPKELM